MTRFLVMSMRMPADLYKAVQRVAAADNRSMANWLRQRAYEHPEIRAQLKQSADVRADLEKRRLRGNRS